MGPDRWPPPCPGTRRPVPAPAAPAPALPATARGRPEWRLILRALWELCGFDRGVFYDVPAAAAPARLPGSPVLLNGSPAWNTYLQAREALDTGDLTLLLAMRPLPPAERLLATDWGTTYANALLLIEPREPAFDLTDPENEQRRALEAAARVVLARRGPEDQPDMPWTRDTAVGARLRRAYGVWWCWSNGRREAPDAVGLSCTGADDTLTGAVAGELRRRFPVESFVSTLAKLTATEPELFSGRAVGRARLPFLTRLGLPVLHESALPVRAVRRLVNEGHVWVYERGPDAVSYHGPARPLPGTMPEAELEHLIM